VLDARNGEALAETAAALRQRGAMVRAIPGDVSDAAHRRQLVAAARDLGGIDLLVNNASTLDPSPLPPLDGYPLDALAEVFRVNVIAPLGLLQDSLPILRGPIVNVTSDAAIEPYEGWGGYGSSKAALDQITRVFAAEHPELHAYSFDPGDMRTQMHQDAFPGDDISDRPEPETVVPVLRRLLAELPPSGRYTAAQLAGAR
jgi:NAD(P)-dependent dehydrogenase (short-subunit alcohol dehydrogenase family)